MKPQFQIGTRFVRATGKHRHIETVVDILTTTNSAGEVVAIRYVSTHEFSGQIVTDRDVPAATIARAKQIHR